MNGNKKQSKPGRVIERRPLKPFDCFRPVFPPPENDPHYGVVALIYKSVAIVAVGTTKHTDEPNFLEVDKDRGSFGLPEITRFLDRFVHAYWYQGLAAHVHGQVPVSRQLAFKRAAERALLAHARGTRIPTMPDRSELAALRTPAFADEFFVDIHELAGTIASAASPKKSPPDDEGTKG